MTAEELNAASDAIAESVSYTATRATYDNSQDDNLFKEIVRLASKELV